MSMFHFFSFRSYLNNIEDEITNNMNNKLRHRVNKLESNLTEIKNLLMHLYYEKSFSPIISSQHLTLYDYWPLQQDFVKFLSRNDYVKEIFMFSNKMKFVLTTQGTFNPDSFFNLAYYNINYTKGFWLDTLNNRQGFKYYKAVEFTDRSKGSKNNPGYLIPLVFKDNYYGSVLVAYIDINKLVSDIDPELLNNFFIYDMKNTKLYPKNKSLSPDDAIEGQNQRFFKTENGYFFTEKSNSNELICYSFIPNTQIKEQLSKTNSILQKFILCSLIISLIISMFIVKRFNNPVKQITQIIQQTKDSVSSSEEEVDFKYIRDNVQRIVLKNLDYQKNINIKNSLLESFFYQSKLKDVYFNIDDINNDFIVRNRYALIIYKVHYKDKYYELTNIDSCKATFFLTELIDVNTGSVFNESLTFQIENDEILSIINIPKDITNIIPCINVIVKNLQNESQYVFFSIAVSHIYDDVSDMKNIYSKLTEIMKYRKLQHNTQIMTEDILANRKHRFYFSELEMKKFTNYIDNLQKKESLKFIENLLDFNIKKDVNNYYINLLCLEIINNGINAVLKKCYVIPEEINVSYAYESLEKCTTIHEYGNVCKELASRIIDYISCNKKEHDYIIDFILEFIDNHYTDDIYLDLIADKLKLNRSYVSSYFKNRVGINLSDYINNYRIKKAIQLIINSNLKIKDISLRVGINNINTFIRQFKKYSGYTPKEYQRRIAKS